MRQCFPAKQNFSGFRILTVILSEVLFCISWMSLECPDHKYMRGRCRIKRSVGNFFLVESETRRRRDIFQAEVTLYWELAVHRCSHPSLTIAQHSRVYTFQGEGIHRGGDNLNKACKCSTGLSPLPEFPQPWPHQHNSVIQIHRC